MGGRTSTPTENHWQLPFKLLYRALKNQLEGSVGVAANKEFFRNMLLSIVTVKEILSIDKILPTLYLYFRWLNCIVLEKLMQPETQCHYTTA